MPFFDRLRRLLPGPVPSDDFARGTRALERGRLEEAETVFAEVLAAAATSAEIAAVRNKRAILAIRKHDIVRAVDELIGAL
ncbi:MAG: hypothetical protein QOJ39_3965, partial [Candidatus Eremiobacteraeota bacterium]|nr:hypothetical protein [Candidatus Eremiobacteraeota bacterium]